MVSNQVGPSGNGPSMTSALNERLSNLENNIDINVPIPKDVYSRLKVLEERVLLLERISPIRQIQDSTNRDLCIKIGIRFFPHAFLLQCRQSRDYIS